MVDLRRQAWSPHRYTSQTGWVDRVSTLACCSLQARALYGADGETLCVPDNTVSATHPLQVFDALQARVEGELSSAGLFAGFLASAEYTETMQRRREATSTSTDTSTTVTPQRVTATSAPSSLTVRDHLEESKSSMTVTPGRLSLGDDSMSVGSGRTPITPVTSPEELARFRIKSRVFGLSIPKKRTQGEWCAQHCCCNDCVVLSIRVRRRRVSAHCLISCSCWPHTCDSAFCSRFTGFHRVCVVSRVVVSPEERSQLRGLGAALKDAAVKAGYLMKSGNHKKSWHRRWFVMAPTGVGYFESETSPEPLGVFMTSEITDVVPDVSRELSLPFAFRVVAMHRAYDMQASNARDQGRWVSAFLSLKPGVTSPIPLQNNNNFFSKGVASVGSGGSGGDSLSSPINGHVK